MAAPRQASSMDGLHQVESNQSLSPGAYPWKAADFPFSILGLSLSPKTVAVKKTNLFNTSDVQFLGRGGRNFRVSLRSS